MKAICLLLAPGAITGARSHPANTLNLDQKTIHVDRLIPDLPGKNDR